MALKIAFGGKGGVGKTTITSLLSRCLAAQSDQCVIAIDADPVTNLAAALGFDESKPITPIAELKEFIEERTGAKPGALGTFFSLNPKVDDIPEQFSQEKDGVKLLVMGTIKDGGGGCICPVSTILKALMNHLVLYQDDIVLMDMEAGVEHLGRATSDSMDGLIIVVNPGARSRAAVPQIQKMAMDIGIKKIYILGNRIRDNEDKELIKTSVGELPIIGFIPETEEIIEADRYGRRPYEDITTIPEELKQIVDNIIQLGKG